MNKIIIGLLLFGLIFMSGCICQYYYEVTEEDGTVARCKSLKTPLFKEGATLSCCDNNMVYTGITEYRKIRNCG